jgi:hypothetical protein
VHQERSEKISEKAKQIQLKWVASVNKEKKEIEDGILKRERKEEVNNKPVKRVAIECMPFSFPYSLFLFFSPVKYN